MQANLATALVSTGVQRVIGNDESLKTFTATTVGPELGRGTTLLLKKAGTEIEFRTGIADKGKKLFKSLQKHYSEKTPDFVKDIVGVPCAVVDGLIIDPAKLVLSYVASQDVVKFVEREGGKFVARSVLDSVFSNEG